jgi:hypothetical protein
VLSYPATIPLSSRTLNLLAARIRRHRNQHRSRWRRLDPARQALLALAHLRNGDTYARLAAGFQVGVATASRQPSQAAPRPTLGWSSRVSRRTTATAMGCCEASGTVPGGLARASRAALSMAAARAVTSTAEPTKVGVEQPGSGWKVVARGGSG